ncbi:MAG: restriction endonuclease subunit S, partial [Crocinitomicaceae bacterium]|nr:restriction endonuclease subunit S [Crocinitomicaceae bacterium]
YVPSNLAIKLSKYQIKKGDILITMSGNRIDGSPDSWVGKVATFNLDGIFLLNQRVSKIKVNSEKINPNYLNYVLGSFEFQNYFINKANSSGGQANISPETVRNTIFSAPDISTQISIAEILSSLDDKIELNNKINQELETLAQTLFKQWFIDFEFPNENGEPYKSSGGEMLDNEIGTFPKGWRVYSMDELLETISKTYPLKKVNEVVFLNTGDIQDGKFLHKNYSNPANLPGQAKKSITQNDILYSEIRPANKRFAYVYFDSSQYVVSTKLMVLRSKVEINSLFQYFYLTQQENIKYLQHLAESRSGTFPQITFSELSTIKIGLPDFDLVNTFVEIALKPYYDNQFRIVEENESLLKLRDTLLQKLISREIQINETNK